MATKKKSAAAAAAGKRSQPTREAAELAARHEQEYNQLVSRFAEALDTFGKGEFAAAKEQFAELVGACDEEPVMLDRARVYVRICERKLAPAEPEPMTAEDRYYRAVLLINDRRADEAMPLLDRALQEDPSSARDLYARASVWAMKSNPDAAVSDLRQAIALDPQVRFQATNDPDFETIREEPAFIDLIEPTPSGA